MADSSYAMDLLNRHVEYLKYYSTAFWEEGLRDRLSKKVIVTTVALGGVAYICYRVCRSKEPQPLPQLDFQEWWGPQEKKNSKDYSIKPFRVEFSEEMIKDLRQRLLQRRPVPPPLEGVGFSYGFNSDYLPQVLNFWRDSYNFQERETFLNRFPQFKTNIQGLDIHYIHVKPSVASNVTVLPLLLLHGWPGSVREFYEVIPILTTQSEDRDFVFEVIVPSLPGYGFSSGALKPGLGTVEIAVVIRNLMHRVGYLQFYVQGGDWGAAIGSNMATLFPKEVLGFHSNMMRVASSRNNMKWLIGSLRPSCVVDEKCKDRFYPVKSIFAYLMEETGYFHIQATKPDTVGVGLSDSPAGLAAYILEKFSTWTNVSFRNLPDGGLTKNFQLVDLLDNLMIYWSSNCITTSMRLYAETMSSKNRNMNMEEIQTTVPTWALKAKHEIFFQPDSFIRSKYVNLLGSTVIDDGGHFMAFELPEVLAEDLIGAVKKFQEFHLKKKNN